MSSSSEKNMNGVEEEKEVPKETKKSTKKLETKTDSGSTGSSSVKRENPKVLFPGDIVIKAQLEDDIRCINYNNQELTFVDLLKLLERLFKKSIKATDDLIIKYKDGDGDLITMEDTDDVGFAIRTCGGLNLKVIRNKPEEETKLKCSDALRTELENIRSRVDQLLDRLDADEPVGVTAASPKGSSSDSSVLVVTSSGNSAQPRTVQVQASEPSAPLTSVQQSSVGNDSTEFDPLSSVSSDSGVLSSDISRGTPQQSHTAPPQTQAEIKQVIDSFQPTPRDTHTPSGIGSVTHRTDQQHDQPSSLHSQHTSALFNRGGGVPTAPKPAVINSDYPQMPGQVPPQQQQQQQYQMSSVSTPTNSEAQSHQPTVPATSMYSGLPTGVSNPYGNTPHYSYQPQGYGTQQQGAYPAVNNTQSAAPTSMSSTWTSTPGRAYSHTGISQTPGTQQTSGAPPTMTQPSYGTVSQTSMNMYGQVTNSQTGPPMTGTTSTPGQGPTPMGVAQAPPPMGGMQPGPPLGGMQIGAQTGGMQLGGAGGMQAPPPVGGLQAAPPMGGAQVPPGMNFNSAFRPTGTAPPPPVGGAVGGTNPYARNARGY